VGDGRARNEVETLFAALHSSCRMLGKLPPDKLWPLLQAADLYLWPAVNEAFGMALLEAQACGLPVLAGDEGGVASIVEPGVSGWLAARRDTQAFAQQLQLLLSQPQQLQAAGRQAWRQVQQRHSLGAASTRLNKLLGPLLGAPKR
jgi:glycosyltransferase involved in cell wall biosynthesis